MLSRREPLASCFIVIICEAKPVKPTTIVREKPFRHFFLTVSLLPFAVSAETTSSVDYIELQTELNASLAHVDALEYELGRYNYQLMEPLEQLARIQLLANRFDDAEATAQHAIQIARYSDGLYTKDQYRLLQLEIDISRTRRDWDDTFEQLDHLTWLVSRKFEGDSASQLQAINWLADTHLQCALDTDSSHRAAHMIKATMLSEYAVQLAQITRRTHEPIYPQLLYALSEKYYVEARGLYGHSKVSYAIRKLFPELDIMNKKQEARDIRYLAGLDKLIMLRDNVAQQEGESLEALAMAEIYLADWKLAFNRSDDIGDEYARAIALLREAGIADARIDRFFANPVVLPRQDFTLSFDAALADIETATSYIVTRVTEAGGSAVAGSTIYQLSLQESSDDLPGFVQERESRGQLPEATGEWSTIALSVAIDTKVKTSTRLNGFHSTSFVTPSIVEVQDDADLDSGALKMTLARVKSIPFRPAFVNGSPIPATFSVNFSFRESESGSLNRLLSLR